MARRNFSYQVLPGPNGGECCVVIDKDSGSVIAQANGPGDLSRFEAALVKVGLPSDYVRLFAAQARGLFNSSVGGSTRP